jgi:hypothetical protein
MKKVIINDNGLNVVILINGKVLLDKNFKDRKDVLPFVYQWRNVSLSLGHEVEINHNW